MDYWHWAGLLWLWVADIAQITDRKYKIKIRMNSPF